MSAFFIIGATAAFALGLGLLVFIVVSAIPSRSAVGDAFDSVGQSPELGTQIEPFSQRLARAIPSGYFGWIQRKIIHAGHMHDWSVGTFVVIKIVVFVAAGLCASIFVLLDPQPLRIVLAFVIVAMGAFGPDIVLSGRADDRQKAIQRALPDTLDQMTIAVEAGLGFEAAMSKAARNGIGPLAEELVRTLQDISIGRSRQDAYTALMARTDQEDLRRFLRAVQQADRYGIAIADVLRVQAGEMRLRRRQRAEEQAMKVPVKIVFPLVFCILPVLFIVLLTPAVLGIVRAFL